MPLFGCQKTQKDFLFCYGCAIIEEQSTKSHAGGNKMALEKGYRNENINSLSDTIIYSKYPNLALNTKLFPIMAGITNPDPSYFVRRIMSVEYAHLYVLEYVISGKGHIEYGKQKYTVQAGDFYLLNRYTTPYYYADQNDPFKKIWVNISGRFMNALAYTYQISEPVLIIHNESLVSYLERIHAELLKYPIEETDKSYNDIMSILLELFQEIDQIRKKNTVVREGVTFQQITEFISENILIPHLDVEYICSYFFISYSTLYRICMKNVGLSPKHYILKLKIDYAKTMLSTTNSTVAAAAEALNFSSPLYFHKVFKKYTGTTPSLWKSGKTDRPE